MKKLTKDEVLAVKDAAVEWFEVSEWGGSVPLRPLNAWAVSEYQSGIMEVRTDAAGKVSGHPNLVGANVKLCALGIADEKGPWFTVAELKERAAGPINRIAERVREISGMTQEAEEQAEGN